MKRAVNGVNRIGGLLRNLTEAANLEQAMQSEAREVLDMVVLVKSYVEGYSISNPQQQFDTRVLAAPLMVEGAADYLAQMLDKLVDNAIAFAEPNTSVIFQLSKHENTARIGSH